MLHIILKTRAISQKVKLPKRKKPGIYTRSQKYEMLILWQVKAISYVESLLKN